MSKRKILAPVEIELKVHVAHPDGHTGIATYSMPVGQPVGAEDIERAVRASVEAVSDQGFALMGPSTFFNKVLIKNKTGLFGSFAVPDEFDFSGFGMAMQELQSPTRDDEEEDELDDAD